MGFLGRDMARPPAHDRVATVLQWEGIVLDPVGATVAIITLEVWWSCIRPGAVVSGESGHGWRSR